ncbi:prepilin-type N-terminal cleavage/methylation domain-containing protein [Massilia jejuensis]|uniref:Prepilin-type N-terminal cleavage/methylation domain-containing protein n=1 Tax=Massilia jejuensis TaxID=648894 RepID=A0ABW0PFT4_9BURK
MAGHSHARGLSLVELLLGLAIGALVMAPLVAMLRSASAAAPVAGARIALERDADFALERIAARIRLTAPSTALIDKPSEEWLKPAVYSVSAGVLVEQIGKKTSPLAEGVTAFGMTVAAADSEQPLVTVSLSLGLPDGGPNTTASATVRMGSAR